MSFKTLIKTFVLLTVLNFVHSIDYCSQAIKTACGGKPHIGCNNPGFPVSDTCRNPQLVTFTADQRNLMIDAHNKKRDLVASGHTNLLPPATNMKVLTWNADSEYLAGLNTEQCQMKHDACRYTTVYNGQNLFISMSSADDQATEDLIQQAVDSWYSEISGMDWGQSDSFTGANGVGHFTQLVWAATTQIGCGMSTYFDGEWYNYLIACNYAPGGNYLGSPVYKKGSQAAADCQNGVSTTYTSLCNLNGLICISLHFLYRWIDY